jgi:hypothetical protein
MSYITLNLASKDQALRDRTVAAVQQEARENPAVADTGFAATVIDNPAEGVQLIWPVALNTEAEYESAIAADNPNPGGDESVISDNMILAAVQASWPDDPAP